MQHRAFVDFAFSTFFAFARFLTRPGGCGTGAFLLLGASLGAQAADDLWPYKVQVGDTLIGISERILVPGASWQTLQRLNRVRNARQLVPGSTLQIPAALLRQTALTAEVVHTHGDVQVLRLQIATGADAGKQVQALVGNQLLGGQLLRAGDTVRTGSQSSAVLRFADGTRVTMRPDSVLKIERSSRLGGSDLVETQLRLESGSADSEVAKEVQKDAPKDAPKEVQKRSRFEIRTPMVHLGVRGTEFRTTATATQSSVEVLEGRVAGVAASQRTGLASSPVNSNAVQRIDGGFGTLATPLGVQAPRALLAAPDLRGLPMLLERLPMQLAWAALPGATAYRAQVLSAANVSAANVAAANVAAAKFSAANVSANTSADGPLLLSGVFASTTSRWADDLPDGTYLLRVRAIDSVGLEGKDGAAAFTLKARPEPPFNTQPQSGERVTTDSLLFQWTRNPAATRYRLQVADKRDFAATRVDMADLTATELRLALPPGEHFWRVASVRDVAGVPDMGPWGDARGFTRVALPAPPITKPPEVTADGVVLAWNPGDATRFRLQVSKDADFKTLLHDETLDSAKWLLRKPEAGSYLVRVRALSADGFEGPYGQPQQVDVARPVPWWWMLVPALVFLL